MKKTFYVILGFAILFVCFIIYRSEIFLYPSHIHAWTQSDKYALALCFLDNGFDFFHPCTFQYTELKSTITAVDFPFHEYIVAILMKLLGTKSPAVFRIYTLLYSLVGLYCLYRLCFLFSKSIYSSIFIILFTFFSPLFLYYQLGFLPSMTSLTTLFIGLYFIFHYFYSEKQKYFWFGILFLTLGSLCRLPFTTFVIALTISFGINYWKNKKIIFHEVAGILLSLSFVAGYFLYNSYLRKVYGSIFLSHIAPADDLEHFIGIIKSAWEQWWYHYFTIYHYLCFLFLLFLFLISKGFSIIGPLPKKFILFTLISLAGVFSYAFLMVKQFQNHDYYFLDTFFSVVIFLTIFLISQIKIINRNLKIAYQAILALSCCLIIFQCLATNDYRTNSTNWDVASIEIENYSGSAKFLDSIGIPRSAKMLVMGATTANMPFILMERNGYMLMDDWADSVSKVLRYPCDFIVFQNIIASQTIVLNNPTIAHQLIKLGDNGKISVYKKGTPVTNQTALQFIGFSETTLRKKIFSDFDSVITDSTILLSAIISDSIYYSKKHSACLKETFSMLAKLNSRNTKSDQVLSCYFEGYFKSDEEGPFYLVASVDDSLKRNISYQSFPIITDTKNNSWTKISFPIQVPSLKDLRHADFYFYNPQQKKIYCDDLLLLVR